VGAAVALVALMVVGCAVAAARRQAAQRAMMEETAARMMCRGQATPPTQRPGEDANEYQLRKLEELSVFPNPRASTSPAMSACVERFKKTHTPP
jgi:hypothetical protein